MARARSEEGQIAILLHEAPKRPDAAAGLMALAADYLREGQAMPQPLADYLANALAKAASAKGADRADVLATELWVKQSANAPIKGREFDVFLLVVKHDAKAQCQPKPQAKELVSDVMQALDVGERTARQRIAAARSRLKEAANMSRK